MDNTKPSSTRKKNLPEHESEKEPSTHTHSKHRGSRKEHRNNDASHIDHHPKVKPEKFGGSIFFDYESSKKPHTTTTTSYEKHNQKDEPIIYNSATVSATTTTDTFTPSSSFHLKSQPKCLLKSFQLIWLDQNIDESDEYFQRSLTKLRKIVFRFKCFTDAEQCVAYLKRNAHEKIYLIVSGRLGQKMMSRIHDMSQIEKIIVFCSNEHKHKAWTKEWSKIEGIYDSIDDVCDILTKSNRASSHEPIPMSFLSKRAAFESASRAPSRDELPPDYMYTVLFKEILLEIHEDDEKSLDDFIDYYAKQGIDQGELKEFRDEYRRGSAIRCYTEENFLYGTLNGALRSLNMEAMMKFGFFIRKLHSELMEFHKRQITDFEEEFTVYRGQGLSNQDFQRLIDIKSGLLSFNSFLSTSKDKHVAMNFVHKAISAQKSDRVVLFTMTIDPRKVSTFKIPFALIEECSAIRVEEEILFTMNTVFRVMDIKQAAKDNRFYEVQLTITDDNDPELAILHDYMRKDIQGSTRWHRMGELMFKTGHIKQAEKLYTELLKSARSNSDKALIFHQLGRIKDQQGIFEEAGDLFKKSLKINLKSVAEDDVLLTPTYAYLGAVYHHMSDYKTALEYYEKSFKILKNQLPAEHLTLATSYNNIAGVHYDKGDYAEAREFFEKSLKIKEKALPPNHPSLATSYSNLGQVFQRMDNYSKAKEFYEKSLNIREKALPPMHIDLASSYSNLAGVRYYEDDYAKALELYEKSLEILKNCLPLNHPTLATTYNNICAVYYHMKRYVKALEFARMELEILKDILPPGNYLIKRITDNIKHLMKL